MNDLVNDCISRQAALTALNGCTEIFLNNLPPTIYKADAVEAVKALPSAQPVEDIHREKEQAYYCGYEDGAKAARSAQPGWIPVTARLPEDAYGCLVTVHYDDYHTGEHDAVYREAVGWDGETWNDWSGLPIDDEVVAWMPLPTPYREGGQDG